MGNKRCTLCPLGKAPHVLNSRIPARTGGGKEPQKGKKYTFLIVGEAPGRQENVRDIPFIGKAGQLLDNILIDLGVDLDDVVITNAVKCQPLNNANPPMLSKRTCFQFLEKEIEDYSPSVIIALGGQAWSSLLDRSSAPVSKDRLKVRESRLGIPMVVTYHPAAILRNKNYLKDLYEDLKAYLIDRIWSEEDNNIGEEIIVQEISTQEEFNNIILPKLLGNNKVALDVETDGLFGRVLCVALSFPEEDMRKGYWIPIYHPETPLTISPKKTLREITKNTLGREDCTLIGHNIKYDIVVLSRYLE